MAVYDLEEQQKIDDLKSWWKQYGGWVMGAVVALCAVVIAVQGWRWYQGSQSQQAGALYSALGQAVQKNDVAAIKDATAQLTSRHASSGYAARAALIAAKAQFDAQDFAGARTQLAWALEHASEPELAQLARYRMAQVLLEEKNHDEALRMLDGPHDESFAALYADLRGDVLLAAGKPGEAKAAYASALAKMDERSALRGLVQVKHDAIGAAQ
jgi:predicted negative regulator of RcsB-dependent stress response